MSSQQVAGHTKPGAHAPSAADYLAARTLFGIKFGLDTMRALVAAMDHPERAAPVLLIAGTNGKGSVVAYLDAALQASGLRVGRYVSPHLVRIHERFTVDGVEIDDHELEDAVARVRTTAENLVQTGRLNAHPTYFEVTTAVAFDHFRRRQVDVAVLEVGLGGRLDCTNVSQPLASAIVSVDRDHMQHLGDTLGEIAREKAGVLREGRPTIVGPMDSAARSVIEEQARQLGADLIDSHKGASVTEEAEGLHVRTPRGDYPGLTALPGHFQRDNLLVALGVIEAAHTAGLAVDIDALPGALGKITWPGRFQWIDGGPPLLLDGAHNASAAETLARELRRLGRPFVLVFGAMEDKDIEAMAGALFPPADEVILTRASDDARAADIESLARRGGHLARRLHRAAAPVEALGLARRRAGPDKLVVVAGSLYLVGAVLGRP